MLGGFGRFLPIGGISAKHIARKQNKAIFRGGNLWGVETYHLVKRKRSSEVVQRFRGIFEKGVRKLQKFFGLSVEIEVNLV
jgi:hypothetical protein